MHFKYFRLSTYSLFSSPWGGCKPSIFDSKRTKYMNYQLSKNNRFLIILTYLLCVKWKVLELLDLELVREVFQNIELVFAF